MSVPSLIKELKNQAAAIGCRLESFSRPLAPHWTTIVIIPDHPLAVKRFREFDVFDGLGICVATRDTDKVRKNSNYYRELKSLQAQFEEARPRLKILADAVSSADRDDTDAARHQYADALRLANETISALREKQ